MTIERAPRNSTAPADVSMGHGKHTFGFQQTQSDFHCALLRGVKSGINELFHGSIGTRKRSQLKQSVLE